MTKRSFGMLIYNLRLLMSVNILLYAANNIYTTFINIRPIHTHTHVIIRYLIEYDSAKISN